MTQHIDIAPILNQLNFEALNPMQEAALEAARQHPNIILLANTGQGKTLAFLLPILERMERSDFSTEAMVIAPTRELAVQIEQVWRQMGTGYKVSCCYGGHKREIEENNLTQAPKLIIGTPGRLCDHIRRGNVDTANIKSLVLDEWDKSLEYGYTDDIAFIMGQLPALTHRMYTSATAALELPSFAKQGNEHILHFVTDGEQEWDKVIIKHTMGRNEEKAQDLYKLLCLIGGRSTIVFCNHKEAVERLSAYLKDQGLLPVHYHGSMEQRERDAALCRFRNGSAHFLVTTDLAARGLDIENVRFVVHYQLPHTTDIYTHRNGRTARQEASGTVVLMLTDTNNIPEYAPADMPLLPLPEAPERPEKPKWVTLYLPHGKKNKINKGDILGYLTQDAALKKEDIGLIEVKDFSSFVAVRRSKAGHIIEFAKNVRIKNKLPKLALLK